jgi:hypothetical protein
MLYLPLFQPAICATLQHTACQQQRTAAPDADILETFHVHDAQTNPAHVHHRLNHLPAHGAFSAAAKQP